MSQLEFKPLADIAESIRYGYTASASQEPIGPHFLRITDIVPLQIDWEAVPYCTIDEKNIEKYRLQPGDVVVARTGATVGYAKLIRDECDAVFASYLVRFRFDRSRVHPGYAGRVLESDVYKRFVLSRVGGAAQPNANAKVLSAFPLPVPPLDTQKRIASILSTYDDLIENNRRRIQLLEQAARLLYKEWFVHLRFPGHEHAKIKDGVPEGWEKVIVPEIIAINPKEAVIKGFDIRYVPMSSLSESDMTINASDTKVRQKATTVKFRNGDTLLARITPCLENGKTGYINFLAEGEVACGSTEFIVLRGKYVSSYFTYCLVRTYDFRENAIKSMIGSSGRQRVQISCFDEYSLGLPPKMLLQQFDEFASRCFEQIWCLMQQNRNLEKARDLLLPRLMNGEIAV